jgi:hypothetical protein
MADFDQRSGVDATVEPIKGIGALLGFAIGFAAAHRSGASTIDAAMHGLVGAVLLWAIAWYLALWLVREMMKSHVDEQRRRYEEHVATLRQRKAGGEDVGALPSIVPHATLELPKPKQ